MATTQLPGAGDFPDNSKLNKTTAPVERPKVDKIVTSEVVEHKKSVWKRIGESFTGDDARHVGDYVLMDVIIPSAKSLITDALTTTIERFFFGDGRARRGGSSYGGYGGHTNYGRASSSPLASPPWGQPTAQPTMSRRAKATHDFREVTIENRQDAALVLDTLTDMADRYDSATVADFYDAVGYTSDYTDRNYGWGREDLREAQIIRVRNGYFITLPPPVPLK